MSEYGIIAGASGRGLLKIAVNLIHAGFWFVWQLFYQVPWTTEEV